MKYWIKYDGGGRSGCWMVLRQDIPENPVMQHSFWPTMEQAMASIERETGRSVALEIRLS